MTSTPARERGSTVPLIVGFASVLLLGVAVVIDASAAYVQHQDLVALADGAALRGADLGAEGAEVYQGGLGAERLGQSEAVARRAVEAYLDAVGARRQFPGLTSSVGVEGTRVVVHLSAPAHLPLRVPGSPDRPRIGATGGSAVQLDQPALRR